MGYKRKYIIFIRPYSGFDGFCFMLEEEGMPQDIGELFSRIRSCDG